MHILKNLQTICHFLSSSAANVPEGEFMRKKHLASSRILAAMGLLTAGALHGTAYLSELVCAGGSCNSSSSSVLTSWGESTPLVTSLAEAWAQDYSTLKAYAQISATNLPNGTVDNVFGTATSVDRLYFPGQTTGTVDFTFNFSGTTSYNIAYGREEVDFSAGHNSSNLTNYLLYRQGNDGLPNAPLVTTLKVTLSYNAFMDYQFTLGSQVYCEALTNPNQVLQPCNGSGTVDFLDTAKLVHIDVFDSTGQLITAPAITSDSGFNYSQFTTAGAGVPEPGTFLPVLLAGIGGWAFLRRIGRRSS
jgi:hypothetical protein